jgi:hypothetical protein
MGRNNNSPLTRRTVLKGAGAAATGSSILAGVPGVLAVGATSDWDCRSKCPQSEIQTKEIDVQGRANNPKAKGAASIHWKRSFWDDDEGAWVHEFSVSGAASSSESFMGGGQIYGHRYQLKSSDGDIQPSTAPDHHGQLPANDDSYIPDYAQPLMAAAIGTLEAGTSWFLAVNQTLREAMGYRPDGFNILPGGVEYGDMASEGVLDPPYSWSQCGYFHRVRFETEEKWPQVNIEQGICDHDSSAATLWNTQTTTLQFFGSREPGPVDVESSSADPREFSEEELERFGIVETEDSEVTTYTAGDREYSVDFVATKNPISVVRSTQIEERESEMRNPYSTRFK